MGVTLIVNPGSSSKKFALAVAGEIKKTYTFETVGDVYELCTAKNGEQQLCEGVQGEIYRSALEYILADLEKNQLIKLPSDITTVGIRVVAPGTVFQQHGLIDTEYIATLQARVHAAPLHIPPILNEIEAIRTFLPQATLIAISDSAFHATMPDVAKTYSIKKADTENHDIYRFGYHGISYGSVVRSVPQLLGSLPSRTIISHVGSGVSMTALKDGKSIDTSMGFGPGSGLVMGSRAGDVDGGVLLELLRVKKITHEAAYDYLQKETGLRGLAEEADFRYLLERSARGDAHATFALEHFCYHWQKQLGAFIAILGGIDALVLTATAAERSAPLRSLLLSSLSQAGIRIDEERNDTLLNRGGVISTSDSPVTVAVVRTNELDEMVRMTSAVVEMR